MNALLLEIDRRLEQGQKLVLARIIRQVGSAPRSIGTRCLILEDHTLVGTIGGGLLEHQVMEKAKEVLVHGRSALVYFRLKGAELARSEMLCGGEVDVYLELLSPAHAGTRRIFRRMASLYQAGLKSLWLTRIADGSDPADETGRALLEKNGAWTGTAPWTTGVDTERFRLRKALLMQHTPMEPLLFLDPVEPDPVLIIFGAGHVSTYIAPLAKTLGFQVIVIDDRPEFADPGRFPDAHQILIKPFTEAFRHLTVNAAAYLVIVTRGHSHDKEVLEQALQAAPAYIGMIGSRKKRDLIYQALMDQGFAKERLQQVHCPIGLAIGAETPEEIAVSIMAELIHAKSGVGNALPMLEK